MGHTDLSLDEVHALAQQMGQEYRGNRCAAGAGGGRGSGGRASRPGRRLPNDTQRAPLTCPTHPPSHPPVPHPRRYHLLQMNCNHFSSDLCARLTGQPAPSWINRLAGIAVSLHCLLPPGWVPPLRPPTMTPVAAAEAAAAELERSRLLNPLEHPGSSDGPPRSAPQLIS